MSVIARSHDTYRDDEAILIPITNQYFQSLNGCTELSIDYLFHYFYRTINRFTMEPGNRKIILAITGASGSVYALKLLETLRQLQTPPEEVAIIFSDTAKEIWITETGGGFVPEHPAKEFSNKTFYAPFASGSSQYDTMIICPASMGTIGRLANGTSDDLISRSADVMLKERRRLIVVPREAPYSLIHIDNLKKLTLAGAIICPASPSFYSNPKTIDDLVMTIVNRIIDLAGFDNNSFRWMDK
jgi:4-hydroxy-3-polyprenylbenzoate decarboxylase